MYDALPDATRMGPVTLKTGDLAALENWYTRGPGLEPVAETPGRVQLGIDGQALVTLEEAPGLRSPDPQSAGLFHTAILYPDASSLAAAVLRMSQVPGLRFAGVGDHHVSQAFYFADPEGNGVELYVDRPREHWTWNGSQVHMTTEWFDANAFVQQHLRPESTGTPTGATVGHVHLQVGDIATAHDFYVSTLGFAETARLGDQAVFVSAGGYHHHMAMNVWNSRGAGRRVDALGLGTVDIVVPDADSLGALKTRVADAGIQLADSGEHVSFDDPWGSRIRVHAESAR